MIFRCTWVRNSRIFTRVSWPPTSAFAQMTSAASSKRFTVQMFIGGMVTGKFVLQIYTVLISLLILGFFLLFKNTIAVASGCNWRLSIFLPGRTATRRQPKPWGRCTGALTLSHIWSTSQTQTGSCCHQTSGAKFTKKWAMWFIFQVAGVLRQYFLLHIFPQYSVFPLFSLLSARFLLLFFPLSRSSIILSPTFCHIPTFPHFLNSISSSSSNLPPPSLILNSFTHSLPSLWPDQLPDWAAVCGAGTGLEQVPAGAPGALRPLLSWAPRHHHRRTDGSVN